MLTHIVCFKYKADTTEAARMDHLVQLKGLRTLRGVIELKAGSDVVRSPRSYDTGLIVKFPDRAALDAYQTDPAHVPVAKYGAGLCDQIVAVDFEG